MTGGGARRDLRRARARPGARSPSSRTAPSRGRRVAADARAGRARALRPRATGASCSASPPSARTRTRSCSCGAAAAARRRRAVVLAGHPEPYDARAAADWPAALGRRRPRRVRRLRARRRARGAVGAGRLRRASRRARRASACRCSRRCAAACRSRARDLPVLREVGGDAAALLRPRRPGRAPRARSPAAIADGDAGGAGPRGPARFTLGGRRGRAPGTPTSARCVADARRPEPRLPRARRDRRHGDLRPRARSRAWPRADDLAPRRVRQPRGAGRRRTVGRVVPMEVVPVHARNRVRVGARRAAARCRALAARAGVRPRPLPRLDRAAARPLPPRHDDPRPELQARPRARTSGCAGSGCACSCRPPRAARTGSIVDAGVDRATTSCAHLRHRPRRRSTSCRSASAAPPRRAPTPEAELRARLGARRPARACCRVAPSARTRTSPRLLDALAAHPAPSAPVLVLPGYPTPHEAELRARAARARASRATCASRPGSRPRTSRASTRWRRRSSSRRCYEGFGLPVLEAMARGVPVACSDRVVAARGRGRRGAALRPRGPGGDRARRSSGCSATAPRRAAARRGPRAGGAFTWERTAELTPRATSARWPRRRLARDRVERALERQPLARCAANHRAVDARSAGAGLVHAHDRGGEVASGVGATSATKPLTPSSTSSTAALSGPRTTTLGVPARGRLDDDQPVALAARGQHRHSARRERRARPRRRSTKPGRLDDAAERRRGDRRAAPRRARARRRRSTPRSPGARARGARDRAARRRARASRGCGGRRRRRAARPAPGSGGARAARVLALEHGRRRRAGPPRAAARACSRAKQNARWGTRSAQRAGRAWPTRPPTRAEVLAPVVARSTPRASRRRAGSAPSGRAQRRRRAARSTGTRRCGRRRSGGRGAAGARSTPAPKRSGGSDAAAARRRRRAPSAARRRRRARPGPRGGSPRRHWRSVR